MSVSAISANQQQTVDSTTSGLTGALQLLATNYNALGQALSSGDLSGAQQAYASLIQGSTDSASSSAGSSSSASGSTSSDSTTPSATSMLGGSDSSSGSSGGSVSSDLVALGQALSSGDLAGAQQAFANLNQAVQAAGQGHGAHGAHHGGGGSSSSDATSGSSSSSASTVTSVVTTTNANGTLTVTTTYADGTKTTAVEPNPQPTQSTNTLDPSNRGQLMALLHAQEQSR